MTLQPKQQYYTNSSQVDLQFDRLLSRAESLKVSGVKVFAETAKHNLVRECVHSLYGLAAEVWRQL